MTIKKIENYVAVCDWCGEVVPAGIDNHGKPYLIIDEELAAHFYDEAWGHFHDSEKGEEVDLCPNCKERYSEREAKKIPLKPCPFCGGEAELSDGICDGWAYGYAIKCKKCGREFQTYKYAQECVEDWNEREATNGD